MPPRAGGRASLADPESAYEVLPLAWTPRVGAFVAVNPWLTRHPARAEGTQCLSRAR